MWKVIVSLSPVIFGVAAWFYIDPAKKIALSEEELRKLYQSPPVKKESLSQKIKKSVGIEKKEN